MKRELKIGIITSPLTPNRKFYKVCGDSYISSNHVDWLTEYGIEIIPIPFDIAPKYYKYYFNRVNGLYFPSGTIYASHSETFLKCASAFFKMSIEANKKGIYTPIWGACMGMQTLMVIAAKNKKVLTEFDSFNTYMTKLELTKEGLESRLMKLWLGSKELAILIKQKKVLHNHMLGVSLENFEKYGLNKFYRMISWNKDRKNQEFVSTIEAKEYPFYGVQWHPENIPMMYRFMEFFKSELSKNTNHLPIPETKILKGHRMKCYQYSNGIYRDCDFYYHNTPDPTLAAKCDEINKKDMKTSTDRIEGP